MDKLNKEYEDMCNEKIKLVKEMSEVIYEIIPVVDSEDSENLAIELVEKGYGNVAQAVKEAFEKLKEKLASCVGEGSYDKVLLQIETCMNVENLINELFTELYGEEE